MRRLLLLLILAAAAAPRAPAQEAGSSFWISTPQAAGAALEGATAAFAAGDWTRASHTLQAVFDRYPFHFSSAAGGRYAGARRRAVQLLAAMPPEGRQTYERLYGAPAEEAVRGAFGSGDRGELLEVVRRFEATEAGLRALLAIADGALLRGRPAEARLALTRLALLHPLAASTPAVRARLALATARDHAEGGPPPHPGEQEAGARPTTPSGDSWPMLGGNAARNRVSGEPAQAPAAYVLPTGLRERNHDHPPLPGNQWSSLRGRGNNAGEGFDRAWDLYAPLHPVVARGHLVYHDGRDLFAYNLYTRALRWTRESDGRIEPEGRTNVSGLFTPVVADGVVYAALESYVPYERQELQGTPITYFLPTRRLCALRLETGELLWQHDEETLRRVSGGDLLERLSITGAPLVRGDRIYAGACYREGTIHNFLVAVDRHTGDLAFATRISQGQQELNLFGRQLHECVPTPVAEAGGVLYYGTNLGVVAAVDALLGTPLWATVYPIEPLPSTFLWFEAPRRWPRFDNGPPIVAGDLLLIAPTDGVFLLALDRATGEIAWKLHYDTQPLGISIRTLQGADEERAYLSGDAVAAVWLRDDPAKGRRAASAAWKTPLLGDYEVAAGRGVLAEESLWLPTHSRIVRLDRLTGERRDEVHFPEEAPSQPGNLVWAEGALLAAGREAILVHYDREAILQRASRGERSSDPAAVLEAAEILLAAGRADRAVAAFDRARELAERQGRTAVRALAQSGLFRTLLERAEARRVETPDASLRDYEGAIAAAPDPTSRLRARAAFDAMLAAQAGRAAMNRRLALLLDIEREHGGTAREGDQVTWRSWALEVMADLHAALGQPARAIESLQRLLAEAPSPEEARRAERHIELVLERWGRDAYRAFEGNASRLFADAFSRGDLAAADRGLALYPNAEAAAGAALELARRRLQRKEAGEAVVVLQRFLARQRTGAPVAEALLLLVEALDARDSHGAAFASLLRVRTRHAGERVPDGSGGTVPAGEVAARWLAREPYARMAKGADALEVRPPLAQRYELAFTGEGILDMPELLGSSPMGLEHLLFLRSGSSVIAVDGAEGRILYRLAIDEASSRGPLVLCGDQLLVLLPREVRVYDAATGRLGATRSLLAMGEGLRLLEHEGQVFLVFRPDRGGGALGVASLHATDATSIWTRVFFPSEAGRVADSVVAGAADRLLLVGENPVRLLFLSAATGADEGQLLLREDRASSLALPPLRIPDGRLLLALPTHLETVRGRAWQQSYDLVLVDSALEPSRAAVWSYARPPDGRSRGLRALAVRGEHIVAVDEDYGATVLALKTGLVVESVARLSMGPATEARAPLASTQPEHPSLLLLLTRSTREAPAYLGAFDLPALRPRYLVEASDAPGEYVSPIEATGVVALSISQDGRGAPPRVLLLDPLSSRALQRIALPDPVPRWFAARVVQGVLVLLSETNTLYGFAPR
ncbi:MAG: outer membrane protein assembly factor BamB family protein [Planctomycetaceae bacterium]